MKSKSNMTWNVYKDVQQKWQRYADSWYTRPHYRKLEDQVIDLEWHARLETEYVEQSDHDCQINKIDRINAQRKSAFEIMVCKII